jgi:hypothetical protein
MAEIVEMRQTCAGAAPVSLVGWLLRRLPFRRRRLGNADDLPERLRRDMGLAPVDAGQRHYREYFSSHGW